MQNCYIHSLRRSNTEIATCPANNDLAVAFRCPAGHIDVLCYIYLPHEERMKPEKTLVNGLAFIM